MTAVVAADPGASAALATRLGRFDDDVLNDDELDTMILMPAIVLACGLALTAIFLLGYDTLV